MIDIVPVNKGFGVEVYGIDLRTTLADSDVRALKAAVDEYAVAILPNQPLTEEQQLDVARLFGPLETSVGSYVVNDKTARRLQHAQLSDVSNLDESGNLLGSDDLRRLVLLSNQLWHTDSSFKKTPASVSLLSAQEAAPIGGATEFADMRAAWDALPSEKKAQLEGLVAIHDYFYSRSLTGFDMSRVPAEWKVRQPPAKQVLVRKLPNGRSSLYLASHIRAIEGMEETEAKALVDELIAFSTQPQFVYRHRWRNDDLVIWDNRATMHRGKDYNQKYRRSMRRATVQDAAPTIPHQ